MKHGVMITAIVMAVLALQAQQQNSPVTSPKVDGEIMLAAVSRDASMLSGGVGPSNRTRAGTVDVEPIARLTAPGDWVDLSCSGERRSGCRKFARDYLSKAHEYTVISADGLGAVVRARPVRLGECFDYAGTGTYTDVAIAGSAIAASSSDMFAAAEPANSLNKQDAMPVRSLLSNLVPKKLDSASGLRISLVKLEGKELYVVQRSFADVPEGERRQLIFGIGYVIPHQFKFLYWKQNVEDEDERIMGKISLKSGREFLITVVNHPEGHFFRVYGIKGDRLTVVYSGGGASC